MCDLCILRVEEGLRERGSEVGMRPAERGRWRAHWREVVVVAALCTWQPLEKPLQLLVAHIRLTPFRDGTER
eukprot:scaffold127222_cov32-Tisochrysis_lutea.AAC.9